MKRFFVVLLLLLVPSILCGCGTITGKIGGWSIWSAASSAVVITNNTENLRFAITKNGTPENEFMVMPGEDFTVPMLNFATKEKKFLVKVKAYDARGRMYGVAKREYSIRKYESEVDGWEINTRNLQERE